eukprot:TRINITY_DN16251_c0_g1_i1.p1 TRINITY_DN16251_c0_g1~~TRINITY_DN16251_c0_g1_i1.p1  ORF type:complete len:345 (+),score=44.03 TRINITY_DN16251_c0_g1_i1:446-1480(+)
MALDFVAGTVGGCAGIVVGHPFDLIKVRLQTQPDVSVATAARSAGEASTSGAGLYKGPMDCLKRTLQKEGVRGLFKGLASPVVGNVPIQAICFGAYGAARRAIYNLEGGSGSITNYAQQPLHQVALAGGFAGFANCFISTPTELVKIKLQMQQETTKKVVKGAAGAGFSGPVECAKHIYRIGGLHGLYRGFWTTALRDSLAFAIYFSFYEGTCRALTPASETPGCQMSPIRTMIAGSVCGAASWALTYPLDVIKSRLQSQEIIPAHNPSPVLAVAGGPATSGERLRSKPVQQPVGMVQCAINSYKSEGVGVFFKGFAPTILRSIPVGAVTFLGFEAVMTLAGEG